MTSAAAAAAPADVFGSCLCLPFEELHTAWNANLNTGRCAIDMYLFEMSFHFHKYWKWNLLPIDWNFLLLRLYVRHRCLSLVHLNAFNSSSASEEVWVDMDVCVEACRRMSFRIFPTLCFYLTFGLDWDCQSAQRGKFSQSHFIWMFYFYLMKLYWHIYLL